MQGRLTDEQRKMGQAMKVLIDLHNSEELSKPIRELQWSRIGSFLNRFHRELEDQGKPRFGTQCSLRFDVSEKLYFFRSSRFKVETKDLNAFRRIMAELKKATQDGQFTHFVLEGADNEVRTTFSVMELDTGEDESEDGMDVSQIPQAKSDAGIIQRGIPLERIAVETIKSKNSYHQVLDNIIIDSINYQKISVDPVTDFGKILIRTKPVCDVEPGIMTVIPTINFPSFRSFVELLRSFLISYQFELGSFERLRICKQCQKLTYEERMGAKEFCSARCKKIFHDQTEPKAIRRCRGRQNSWIRYQLEDLPKHPVYLGKHDCEECKGKKKGGECKVLIEKNQKLLEEASKHKEELKLQRSD